LPYLGSPQLQEQPALLVLTALMVLARMEPTIYYHHPDPNARDDTSSVRFWWKWRIWREFQKSPKKLKR
jgi:hypothetical protein